MKKLIVLSLLFVVFFFLPTTNYLLITHAANASPSSIIQSKLDELKKEIASKAAALKNEVNKNLQNKAYVGIIKTKSDTSLTLAAKSGSKIVNTNQDTIFSGTVVSKTGKKTPLTLALLNQEDYIAALGDIDDTGVLTAKKIILLPAMNSKQKTHLWGEVISVSGQTVALKDKDSKNQTVLISGETDFKNGTDDAAFSDISKGDLIIASGYLNDNQTLTASLIYIIPQGPQTPKPSPTATPSATPKPTKSPKPTAKPS